MIPNQPHAQPSTCENCQKLLQYQIEIARSQTTGQPQFPCTNCASHSQQEQELDRGECSLGYPKANCDKYESCGKCHTNEKTWLEQHDALTRKEERERVLKELFPKSHSGESGWRYDLKFLSHLEFKIEERNEYHFQCEDIEEILTVLEESLRAGDE